jgi:hypothetical protein
VTWPFRGGTVGILPRGAGSAALDTLLVSGRWIRLLPPLVVSPCGLVEISRKSFADESVRLRYLVACLY